jgi:5'-deoxynucleotidase YfbR-like HD superfamily hydrolase
MTTHTRSNAYSGFDTSINVAQIPASLSFRQAALQRLLFELQDLKRLTSAEFEGTFAAHRYRQVIHRLANTAARSTDSADIAELALDETVCAVVATRLSALGPGVLHRLGTPLSRIREICQAAFDEHKGAWCRTIPEHSLNRIAKASDLSPSAMANEPLDILIKRLCDEPRAGATAPQKRRMLVVPQESQAEHCYLTAVTAVVLADYFDADPGEVFVVALLHHLHNGFMPDAGFAGETLLGESLADIVNAARDQALAYLSPALQDMAIKASATITHLETPVARVVNAADAIDRVLQTRFHEQMASFDAARVQRELDLVHAGPLQAFQRTVLKDIGLW